MNNQIALGWGLITAAFFGGAPFAWAAESIGGAEIVVNEVKGNLTAGKVVTVLRGDDVYRDEGVKTEADSTAKLVLRDKTILTVGPSSTGSLRLCWRGFDGRDCGELAHGRTSFQHWQRR